MINKHGYPMKGLKDAAASTKGLHGYYSGFYVQISYDMSDGTILTNLHYNLGQNSWTEYDDSNVITIGNVSEHKTIQEIADMICDEMSMRKAMEDYEYV